MYTAEEQEARWQQTYQAFYPKIRTFARNLYRWVGYTPEGFEKVSGLNLEDLEQELLVVLWKCLETYDPAKGSAFNTYFQTAARNRLVLIGRHFRTKKRFSTWVSLDDEAVAQAIDEFLLEASSEDEAIAALAVAERIQRSMPVKNERRRRVS